ncbi:hypothetical protein AAVH_19849 [Aphelenchoides avenae]|nr:hypothetical protein AAVH_19849 [Aphelenchus avenae]
MSSSGSSRSGDTPQSGDQRSCEKKRVGAPYKRCPDPDHEDPLKRGCGRMPTEETAKNCPRCAKKLRNRVDKQRSRSRNPRTKSGSSSEDAGKNKMTDGAQLVDQVRQLAANALYQLSGCDHCSSILQQLEAELAGLLGDLFEPYPRADNVGTEDAEEWPVSDGASAEDAPSGSQVVTTPEIYLPTQQLYSAPSTVQGQFAVYAPPTPSSLQNYVRHASAGDAAQSIAAPNRQCVVFSNYVPPLSTQLLGVDTTLPVNVMNAFDDRGLHPLNFFDGDQLRISEVFQKAAEALNAFEVEMERQGPRQDKFIDFLTPANFRFIRLPSNRRNDVPKGRYTGFAVLVQIVDIRTTVQEAMRCPATRRLLAPEILAGQPPTATSRSWSLYRMYYDALTSKKPGADTPRMQLIQTSDNVYHFVEKAIMKKGPVVREEGWWELNPHITYTLYGGLFSGPQGHRLGIKDFIRLFKRTNDGRYVDSRICADAFGSDQRYVDARWFRN